MEHDGKCFYVLVVLVLGKLIGESIEWLIYDVLVVEL